MTEAQILHIANTARAIQQYDEALFFDDVITIGVNIVLGPKELLTISPKEFTDKHVHRQYADLIKTFGIELEAIACKHLMQVRASATPAPS